MTDTDLLNCPLPIVAAPMAGGGTTVDLVAAAAGTGGFGFLAAGYQTPSRLAADMATLRNGGIGFGVNLFVPGPSGITDTEFRDYATELAPDAEPYGLDLTAVVRREDDDAWSDKIDLLLADPVPVLSVTFGIPDPAALTALHRVGTRILITVTTRDEAIAARDFGADGLIAQGSAAGGHSGTHDPRRRIVHTDTADLVRDVRDATGLPVIAAGGIGTPQRVHELRAAGACAVAVGTVLLRSDESGARQIHKDALADPGRTDTVITHAFTGRPARALRNGFTDRHDATAPYGYPAIHHLTRELRAAAAEAGDPERVHLWAGTGYRHAVTGPAAGIITKLAEGL